MNNSPPSTIAPSGLALAPPRASNRGRKKNLVWTHFIALENHKAQCKYCGAVVRARANETMKDHYLECDVAVRNPELINQLEQPGSAPRRKATPSTTNITTNGITNNVPNTNTNGGGIDIGPSRKKIKKPLQPQISLPIGSLSATNKQISAEVAVHKLAQFLFATSGVPLETLDSPEFRDFVRYLNPDFETVSSQDFVNKILVNYAALGIASTEKSLVQAKALTIRVDDWTSSESERTFAVHAVLPSGEAHLLDLLHAGPTTTGNQLYDRVLAVLLAIPQKKMVGLIVPSEDDRLMRDFANSIRSHYPWVIEMSDMGDLLGRMGYEILVSRHAREVYAAALQIVETSDFIEHAPREKDELLEFVNIIKLVLQNKDLVSNRNETFWKDFQDCLTIAEPVANAVTAFQSPSFDLADPFVHLLKIVNGVFSAPQYLLQKDYKSLLPLLKKAKDHHITRPVLQCAALLDPKFHPKFSSVTHSNILTFLHSMLKSLGATNDICIRLTSDYWRYVADDHAWYDRKSYPTLGPVAERLFSLSLRRPSGKGWLARLRAVGVAKDALTMGCKAGKMPTQAPIEYLPQPHSARSTVAPLSEQELESLTTIFAEHGELQRLVGWEGDPNSGHEGMKDEEMLALLL